MKRNIEINDELHDILSSVQDDIHDELMRYLADNPDCDAVPCLHNDLDYSGAIHEIIDGAVPVYTNQINDIFYLHGDEVEQAFDDSGIGSKDDKGWPAGWKAAAIYCWLEQKASEWYQDNAADTFETWKANKAA